MVQLLAFRCQFCFGSESQRDSFRGLLQQLMLDSQQEVREAASTVISGFVRLYGSSERQLALEWIQSHIRRGASLVERHAGVLTLSALVMLAPYDVPGWLPEVGSCASLEYSVLDVSCLIACIAL